MTAREPAALNRPRASGEGCASARPLEGCSPAVATLSGDAGHANAAGGEPILWLVGVDQVTTKLTGFPAEDTAAVWRRLLREFNGHHAPEPSTDVRVPWKNSAVLAIRFETDQPPYVVRNAASGPVDWDVPWRTLTETRSATREQLLRILVPVSRQPTVDVRPSTLFIEERDGEEKRDFWQVALALYIVPPEDGRYVYPFKDFVVDVSVGDVAISFQEHLKVTVPWEWARGGGGFTTGMPSRRPASLTMEQGPHELIVYAAGQFHVDSWAYTERRPIPKGRVEISLAFREAGSVDEIKVRATLKRVRTKKAANPSERALWTVSGQRTNRSLWGWSGLSCSSSGAARAKGGIPFRQAAPSGSVRRPDDAGAAEDGRDQALVSVGPLDAVAHAHLPPDHLEDLSLARGRADLR